MKMLPCLNDNFFVDVPSDDSTNLPERALQNELAADALAASGSGDVEKTPAVGPVARSVVTGAPVISPQGLTAAQHNPFPKDRWTYPGHRSQHAAFGGPE